jgi:hypothetical protein
MWNDGGKRQVWRGLIIVAGVLLATAVYWGTSWGSFGSGLAEAATLAAPTKTAPTPPVGRGRSGQTHARSHATRRHRLASRHTGSRSRRTNELPVETRGTSSPSSDTGDLKDVTPAASPAPAIVTILAGNVDGTAAHIAADISAVLDSDDMRERTSQVLS